MSSTERTYLPAAGLDVFLPLYDPLLRLFGADRLRRKLFDQAAVQTHHRILDIGCGTGTFAVAIKRWLPTVEVVGLDPDPRALARSRRKAERAGVSIRFDRGFADALPYPDAAFDRVFSCLMFHHLPPDAKLATLREVRRVLKPGGSLHLLDFERQETRRHNPLGRWLQASERMRDNTGERLRRWTHEAGLGQATTRSAGPWIFGPLLYFSARTAMDRELPAANRPEH